MPKGEKMETFVLITGASSGLGADFARRYAMEGKNLILTARRLDRLEELKSEIEAKHRVKVEVISADLSSSAGRKLVIDHCLGRVGILVNNAGFGIGSNFESTPYPRVQELIDVNVSAVSSFCHAFIPEMKARGEGSILNIASMAGFTAGPYMAAYYASKAFVLSLSEALHEELLPFNVHVVAVCPGPTLTEFFDHTGPKRALGQNLFLMNSDNVVRQAIRDARRNKAIAISGFRNQFLHFLTILLGRRVARKSVAKIQGSRQ